MDVKIVPPMIYQDDFVEHASIGWRIEQAVLDTANPLILPQYPWEGATPCAGHGTVLKDPIDGVFKAWVVTVEEEEPLDWMNKPSEGYFERSVVKFPARLAYYTSEDGVHWDRPLLDNGVTYPGYDKTNLVFPDACGRTTMATVLIEPDLNPDEPYEMFVFHESHFIDGKPTTVPGFTTPGMGLFRYRSKNGLSWRPEGEPINFLADGDGLFIYRSADGTYRMHHKVGMEAFPGGMVPYDCYPGGVRLIWERTSADGVNWSEKFPIGVPNWKDHHGDQFIDLGYHPYGEGIIAIANIFHTVSQTFEPRFAASRDGRKWWRPSDRGCIPLLPLGDIGGGLIWNTRELIEDGDRVYLYYGATDGLHGDINAKCWNLYTYYGGMCRASWEKGRMWAAVPSTGGPIEAYLTTPILNCKNKTLILNAVTLGDGEITVELLDNEMKPIPRFSCADAVPFRGDDKLAVFNWKQAGNICIDEAHIRIYLKRARLYGYALI